MNSKSCFAPAHILLPSAQIPLEQWGCIACDQFTSDREYWQKAEAAAAGSPSTLNLICRKSIWRTATRTPVLKRSTPP